MQLTSFALWHRYSSHFSHHLSVSIYSVLLLLSKVTLYDFRHFVSKDSALRGFSTGDLQSPTAKPSPLCASKKKSAATSFCKTDQLVAALFFLLAIHPYLNLIYYRSFCMQHMQEADFYLLCETPA